MFANHYHFVVWGCPDSKPMRDFLRELHSRSAIALNGLDGVKGRTVWHNFWHTRLTLQHPYLARTAGPAFRKTPSPLALRFTLRAQAKESSHFRSDIPEMQG